MEITEQRRRSLQKKYNPVWIALQDGTMRFRKEQATPEFLELLKQNRLYPDFKSNGEFECKVR